MKQFDVIMPFYISLLSWPNINTLCTTVNGERFSVFRVDHCVQKSGRLCNSVSSESVTRMSLLHRPKEQIVGVTVLGENKQICHEEVTEQNSCRQRCELSETL